MKFDFKNLPDIFRFDLPDGLAFHLSVDSYTLANVAKGTIQDTHTDLGIFNDGAIDLAALAHSLAQYVLPENTPQWRIDMLEKMQGASGSYSLIIELVAEPAHAQGPAHAPAPEAIHEPVHIVGTPAGHHMQHFV